MFIILGFCLNSSQCSIFVVSFSLRLHSHWHEYKSGYSKHELAYIPLAAVRINTSSVQERFVFVWAVSVWALFLGNPYEYSYCYLFRRHIVKMVQFLAWTATYNLISDSGVNFTFGIFHSFHGDWITSVTVLVRQYEWLWSLHSYKLHSYE